MWGHLPFSEDKTVQQSILDKAVEAAPLRKIMGTTNKNWRTYETGQIDRNKAGSLNYHTIDSKLDKPILKLQQDIISIPQFKKEVTKLIQETEPSDQFKMVMRMNQEVKAKALLNTFLKNPHYKTDTYAEYKQDLYGELQPMVYWKVLRSINNPKIRAENYLAEYEQVDDKWKQRFKDLAVAYGFFNNGFFSREVQKLTKKQTVYK